MAETLIDYPGPNFIWVKCDEFGSCSTNFQDSSKSWWMGKCQVEAVGATVQGVDKGDWVTVRVGDGKPWFIRPRQYEDDRRSMFIEACHIVAIVKPSDFQAAA